jgi:hypothetical protein
MHIYVHSKELKSMEVYDPNMYPPPHMTCMYPPPHIHSKELKSMEVYDPNLGTWSYETSLPSRRWALCMIAV